MRVPNYLSKSEAIALYSDTFMVSEAKAAVACKNVFKLPGMSEYVKVGDRRQYAVRKSDFKEYLERMCDSTTIPEIVRTYSLPQYLVILAIQALQIPKYREKYILTKREAESVVNLTKHMQADIRDKQVNKQIQAFIEEIEHEQNTEQRW